MCIEPPLPLDRPPCAPGELGHDALGVEAHDQHVAVVAIAGDLGVLALLRRHGDAGDDRFLADIEVAEAADQPHAIHLAGLLLEAPDQQHVAIGLELLVLGELRGYWRVAGFAGLPQACAP